MRARWAVIAVVGAAVLGVALGAVIWSTGDEDPGAARAAPAGGELFVRTAQSGTLAPVPGRTRTYRLALERLGGPVTRFTDRPQRSAATESTSEFVRRWDSRGFDHTIVEPSSVQNWEVMARRRP